MPMKKPRGFILYWLRAECPRHDCEWLRSQPMKAGMPWRNGSCGIEKIDGLAVHPGAAGDARQDRAVREFGVSFLQTPNPRCPPDARFPRRAVCHPHGGRPACRWFPCRRASGRRPCRDITRSSGCRPSRHQAAGRTPRRDPRRPPSSPFTPAASKACRTVHAKSVSASMFSGRTSGPWRSMRKNQLPPHATSPVTFPQPGTSTATSFAVR